MNTNVNPAIKNLTVYAQSKRQITPSNAAIAIAWTQNEFSRYFLLKAAGKLLLVIIAAVVAVQGGIAPAVVTDTGTIEQICSNNSFSCSNPNNHPD